MIESLTLRNFRRFADLTVELAPVTVFAGKSGSGKSTLIRALRWLAFNRPAGDGVFRWGGESARATVVVDGHKVTRSRGPKGNAYKMDGVVYRSFGQDVPEDVATLFNVDPDLNFSGQHSRPFLFGLSPGEAARELNSVVNLDLIDRVLSHLAAGVRRTKVEVSVSESRLAEAERQAESLAWSVDADADLKAAEEAEAVAVVAERRHQSAAVLLDRARGCLRAVEAARGALTGLEDDLEAVDAARRKSERRSVRLATADALLERVRSAAARSRAAMKEAEVAETALAGAAGGRCPVCGRED